MNRPLVFSVVICTHNPRPDYLERVLAALRKQTLSINEWELLVIDNASSDLVGPRFDITWHPHGRHLHEPVLGKTAALLLGISQATGDILVTVDDDNILDADYLDQALQIGRKHHFLGAWGSGTIRPEFEVEPPVWAKPYLGYLALLEAERDEWSNLVQKFNTVPWGAGQVVRSHVARAYATQCVKSGIRLALCRKGNALLTGEDCDLALTACDLGLGTGRFRGLGLTHLIPSRRLQLDYLLRLVEDTTYSNQILLSFRKPAQGEPCRNGIEPRRPRIGQRLVMAYNRWCIPRIELAFQDARDRGYARAVTFLNSR
jgi:glycosyltransferase involved in cell wall biosynthesis